MTPASEARLVRDSVTAWGLITPMLLVVVLCFIVPLFAMGAISFSPSEGGTLLPGFTLNAYTSFIADPFYQATIVRSIELSATVTLLALLLTYPIALFLHRLQSRWRGLLVVITIAPLLLSAVVRTYGWMVIMGDNGWINAVLHFVGLPGVHLFNTYNGVLIGMTEIMMPYMALGLIAGFNRIEPVLEEAAASLGANPWRRFYRVTLPLSMPGIGLGCLLCFVLAMSAFVTPSLLGGGRVFTLATEIYDQAVTSLNWPLAAAMSMFALVFFTAVMVVYNRFSRRWESV